MRKFIGSLSLAVAAVALAGAPASAASGPFIRIDAKIPLAQGGASVTGTIRCGPENFRLIRVSLAQGGEFAEADGGIQCDGLRQRFEVYVPGQFHPGDARAAAVSRPSQDGLHTVSGPVLRDHRNVVIQAPLP